MVLHKNIFPFFIFYTANETAFHVILVMYFLITVDTEADNQWKRESPRTVDNIRFLPRFQKLCEQYGFIPTYLITHEVAVDPFAIDLLSGWREKGTAEIGAHLHPWTTPPLLPDEERAVPEKRFPSQLSDDLLRQKLETLTRTIQNNFSFAPKIFRAGKWGLDERMIDYLSEFGYIVDCSVSPKVNWRDFVDSSKMDGVPDYSRSPVFPHFLYSRKGRKIFEVPVTILYTRFGFTEFFFPFHTRLGHMPYRVRFFMQRLYRLRWCRVFPETQVSDLVSLYELAGKNRLPIFEFIIHSSELMPGGSPYNKTRESIEKMYTTLESFFSFLSKQDVNGSGLQIFADSYGSS
ncbi:MAG TPA: hypothetical protein DCY48_04660 [Candidatus Magasanikbacteria bacterium]|nr:MAG: hypothetical protein A3I74_03150 [Candidatus Magasanikbacteria bacterium RIFCSPLOWO2_02_FULL_47_16]OGH80208.1 MAG: hypothetical protein A3C10_03430 [Candidatus Magasanikbacteria bacterium RIFCSPHIGHO2_02_FULL_48_18]HAZ29033.1 hypothetical protein [Candidatus Magasanikbacteria bacterium]